jgi:hypothetical protein
MRLAGSVFFGEGAAESFRVVALPNVLLDLWICWHHDLIALAVSRRITVRMSFAISLSRLSPEANSRYA